MQTRTRRDFLKFGVAWPQWMPRLAFAPPYTAPRGDVLVCVFLRGAADGLNMIVPHGDAHYYAQRPALAIPRPDDQAIAQNLRTQDLGRLLRAASGHWPRCCRCGKATTWPQYRPLVRQMSRALISGRWS